MKTIYKILLATTALLSVPFFSFAQFNVHQGGTGLSNVTSGNVLFGSSNLRLGQSINLFWDDINNFLGIATSTPQATLDVNGPSIFRDSMQFLGGTFDILNVGNGQGIYFSTTSDETGASFIGEDVNINTPNLVFNGSDHGPFDFDMTIATDGNVGISTTSPYSKLAVAGQVVAQNYVATSTTSINSFAGKTGIGSTTPYARFSIDQTPGDTTIFAMGIQGSSTPLMVATQGIENQNTGRIGIGVARPTTFFQVTGLKMPDTTTSNGLSAVSQAINMTAGNGGDSYRVSAGSVQGGTGGAINFSGGAGGTSSFGAARNLGGTGGDLIFTGGPGGTPTSTTVLSQGGLGGSFQFNTGNGGSPTGGTASNTGGSAGAMTITTGNGGGSGTVTTGGNGGLITMVTGSGGFATSTAGAGGSIIITANQGGSQISGGTSLKQGGASGGVSITIASGGNGITGGNEGSYSFTASHGGEGTTGNGGAGTTMTFQAGTGGLTTSGGNGGAAGTLNFTAGDSGTGGTRPNGGSIYFLPGTGTVDGNVLLNVNSSGVTRGNVGIGTTSPYSMFSIAGQVVAKNYVATSTTAVNTFPNASTTLLSIGGVNINPYSYRSFTYATSTWTGTTTIPLGVAYGEVWDSVRCFTDVGTVNVDIYHASSHMDMFNASTTKGTVILSTNNVATDGDSEFVNIGTPASSPTKIACTVKNHNPN